MDRSETYVKMSDNPDIQEDHTDSEGDLYAYYFDGRDNYRKLEFIRYSSYQQNPKHYSHLQAIWLPRQDQLQEMVGFTGQNCGWFYHWVSSEIYDLPDDKQNYRFKDHWYRHIPDYFNGSMEQLLLAFLMKEKYNKVWEGEIWQISLS